MRSLRALAVAAVLLAPSLAFAGKADSVERDLEGGDAEGAQKKCERWEAAQPSTEGALREACARAFWVSAQAEDTVVAWASFRSNWKGTDAAGRALDREAEAALRSLDMRASEGDLLALAKAYPDTMAGDEARLAAMDAAVRDADSPEAAVAVARKYAGHAGLPKLVSRFPEGFFSVEVHGYDVKWVMDPPVALPSELAPRVRWVARDDTGVLGDWDRTVRSELLDGGLTAAAIDAMRPKDGRALPLCMVPGRQNNFRPAAVLQVGQGQVVADADWDEGCGPTSWPVFVAVQGRGVTSVSLEPGHRIDLGPVSDASSADLGSLLAGVGPGSALMADGLIYERGTRAWLVHAVSGGVPWLNALGPPDGATPLDSSLRGPAIPRGWRVAVEGGGNRIYSSSVGGERPPWRLGAGEVRILAPMVQAVLGLRQVDATPKGPRAPALTASVPFETSSAGLVLPRPPQGAAMAGLYAVDAKELAGFEEQLVAVGLTNVRILDAWRSDLDGDKVPETLLRAEREGEGIAIVLDPFKKNAPRIFPFACPQVRMGDKVAPTPFSFRLNDHVYLAWAGMEQVDAAVWDSWVMALRADGESYALDQLHRTLGPSGATP